MVYAYTVVNHSRPVQRPQAREYILARSLQLSVVSVKGWYDFVNDSI